MELHTDDFPLLLNRDFYKDLIENFKLIEHECFQLESDLSNEISARINADNNERSERINQDANLQNQINELSGRMDQAESNISNLQTRMSTAEEQIKKLSGRMDQAESNISNLQTRMSTAEEQIKKLNEIIFGTEYINDTDDIPLDDSMTPGKEVEISDTDVINDDKAEIAPLKDYTTLDNEIN